VRILRMWCRDAHLERYLAARMYRSSFELQVVIMYVRLVGGLAVCCVTDSLDVTMVTVPFLCLNIAFRHYVHRLPDMEAAHRLAVRACWGFEVLWHMAVCARSKLFDVGPGSRFPPWVQLAFCLGLMMRIVDMSMTLTLSSPSALASRAFALCLYGLPNLMANAALRDSAHYQAFAAIVGWIVVYLLELQQRTHLLTVLQMQQSALIAASSKRITPEEQHAITHAFSPDTLPPAVLRARVDMGDLVLGQVLGNGTFGKVQLSQWTHGGMHRAVATKSLHRSRITEPSLRSLTRALEVEIGLGSHANIVAMLGMAWSIDMGRVVVLFEYCAGGTLHSALTSGQSRLWPIPRKLLTAAGIADGLGYLHSLSPPVVHRDLKPENILFARSAYEGEPKITDFGEARFVEETANMMTMGRGTPYFSAPEQMYSRDYSTPADVWALGCVLTCIWSNSEVPYPREELDEPNVMSRIMAGRLSPTVSNENGAIYGFVRECCHYTPGRRTRAEKIELQLSKAARMCSLSNLPDAVESPPALSRRGLLSDQQHSCAEYAGHLSDSKKTV